MMKNLKMKNCLLWKDKSIATKKIAGWLLENVTEEVDDKAVNANID